MAGETCDAKATFVKNIQRVEGHLREGQYGACASTASEMTHFSCMLGHKVWVFVSEVLESVFGNMYHLSKHLDLPNEDEKSIRSKLSQNAGAVLHAIESGDDDKIFQPLVQMRFDTTEFQMKVWTARPKIQEGAT